MIKGIDPSNDIDENPTALIKFGIPCFVHELPRTKSGQRTAAHLAVDFVIRSDYCFEHRS